MVETTEGPWTNKEICGNLLAIIISMGLATFMLLLKSWLFLIGYWLIWAIMIIVGRALVCRHCNFLGKKCPTWCMGLIGSKLYKRSDKKDFTEIKIWKFWFDVALIAFAMLFPFIIYVYYIISEGLLLLDILLAIIYLIVGIITMLIHTMGCKKCTVNGCPLRPKSHL
jgi:hypothetical protein